MPSHEKTTRFLTAAITDIPETVLAMLDDVPFLARSVRKKRLLETKNGNRQTALHLAALNGSTETAQVLIKSGANHSPRDQRHGAMPLHFAASSNSLKISQMLVDAGASVDSLTERGYFMADPHWYRQVVDDKSSVATPLHYAAGNDAVDVGRFLVSSGCDINFRDSSGQTPLFLATWFNSLQMVAHLLDQGADPNIEDVGGKAPIDIVELHNEIPKLPKTSPVIKKMLQNARNGNPPLEGTIFSATEANLPDEVDILIELGAGVDEGNQGTTGESPLHIAAKHGFFDVATLLLVNRANPEGTDEQRFTPLHHCAKSDSGDIAELLLKRNVDVNFRDQEQSTPLHIASANNSLTMIEILIKNGAQIDSINTSTETPIFSAVRANQPGSLERLLAAGASSVEVDQDGNSLLHIASMNDHSINVGLLLQAGAPIEHKNSRLETSLHLAAKYKSHTTIGVLLEHGADVAAKDALGQSPLHIGISNSTYVEYMRLRDRRPGRNNNSWNPSAVAFTIQWLIERGADINSIDSYGRTPLHIGSICNASAGVSLLLEAGADRTVKDRGGFTPPELAKQHNAAEVVASFSATPTTPNDLSKNSRGCPTT